MSESPWSPEDIPLDKPNAARMYDYLLGGYHNFEIDRRAAEQVRSVNSDAPLVMQANRAFLRRAVTFLVSQGIDQFLDLGSGIPTVGNVHEVAQQLNPAARVAYVDIEPVAVRHSQAILQDNTRAMAMLADVLHIEQVLSDPNVIDLLDFDKPIAVLMLAVLHFLTNDEQAFQLTRVLREAVVPGSYIAISHGSYENVTPAVHQQTEQLYAKSTTPVKLRSRAEIARFFDGLELVEPGLVDAPLWRPEGPDDLFLDDPQRSVTFSGVGCKP